MNYFLLFIYFLIFSSSIFSMIPYEKGKIYLKYNQNEKAKKYFYQSYQESGDVLKYYSLYEYVKLNNDLKENIYLLEHSFPNIKDSAIKIKFLQLLAEIYFLNQNYSKSYSFLNRILKIINLNEKYGKYQKETIFFLEKIRFIQNKVKETNFDILFNQIFNLKEDKIYYQKLRYIFANSFYLQKKWEKVYFLYQKYTKFPVGVKDLILLFKINIFLNEESKAYAIYQEILKKYPESMNSNEMIEISSLVKNIKNEKSNIDLSKMEEYILQIGLFEKRSLANSLKKRIKDKVNLDIFIKDYVFNKKKYYQAYLGPFKMENISYYQKILIKNGISSIKKKYE